MKRNVLILSAGRRVELVQAFETELKTRLPAAKLFAADMTPQRSAACQVADKAFETPPISDAQYVPALLDMCEKFGIGLIIPTIDTDLLILSENRELFKKIGSNVIVSSARLVRSCRDKRKTSVLFESIGIKTPAIFNRDSLTFPCFSKPINGSRSVGANYIADADHLVKLDAFGDDIMYMEYVDSSYIEYTVDAFFDREGRLRCLVPRQRIEVRDGEVSKGVTRRNFVYEYLWPRIEKISGAIGCLTIQLFARDSDEDCTAIEINPRFGGGYPLTYAAGGNYPGWLVDEYFLGKPVETNDVWEMNLLMLRYDAKVLVRNGA